MLQTKSFVTFSLFMFLVFLPGIGSCRPQKPVVEVGIIDAETFEVISGISGQGSNTSTIRVPLINYDKATSFKTKEWVKYRNYVKEMEAYATMLENNCK